MNVLHTIDRPTRAADQSHYGRAVQSLPLFMRQRVLPVFCERRTVLSCQLAYLSDLALQFGGRGQRLFDSGGFARLLWR